VAKKPTIVVKKGLDEWVMTYGDMMSLLLTFFVLIVSFSSMQETKFEQAAQSLKVAFNVLEKPEAVIELNTPIVPRKEYDTPADLEFLFEVRSIEKVVLEQQQEKDVQVEITDEGVLFRMSAPFLFASGQAELLPEAAPLLDRLARMFRKFPAAVRVEGHTDDIPIQSGRFPSNWELSATRAVAVARYFQGTGLPPERLSATGYGEFQPVADNATPEGRAANRRVEILLKWRPRETDKQDALPVEEAVAAPPAREKEPAAPAETPGGTIIDPVTSRLSPITGPGLK
jgi:chemotaxis protein MotB